MFEKVTGIYFSPTDNTKKSIKAMMTATNLKEEELDLSLISQVPVKKEFTQKDLVIFGMPVYAGRIPNVAKSRLTGLKGNQTPCVVLVTYGNRDFDDALLELADTVSEQGFLPIGAASLIGRHTYGEIQVDRPNQEDLEADQNFIKSLLLKSEFNKVQIPGNRPYKEGGQGGSFHPLTSKECKKCGICIKNCPVQAIAPDCETINDACIACFRCIRNCPVNAKNMDVAPYNEFAAAFSEKLKNRRENEFFK